MTLGQFVARRRIELGLSNADLASASGLSKSELSALEAGRVKLPGAVKRRALADALYLRHVDLLVVAGELTPEEVPGLDADWARTASQVELLWSRLPRETRAPMYKVLQKLAEGHDLLRLISRAPGEEPPVELIPAQAGTETETETS